MNVIQKTQTKMASKYQQPKFCSNITNLNVVPGFPQLQVIDEIEFVVFSVGPSNPAVHLLPHVVFQSRLVPESLNNKL